MYLVRSTSYSKMWNDLVIAATGIGIGCSVYPGLDLNLALSPPKCTNIFSKANFDYCPIVNNVDIWELPLWDAVCLVARLWHGPVPYSQTPREHVSSKILIQHTMRGIGMSRMGLLSKLPHIDLGVSPFGCF
jgi:hypothetical protein